MSAAPSSLRVAVLGPVLVLGPSGEGLVEPPGSRGKALVATLALASGGSVSAPRLIDELWGDSPPRAGKAALQTLVSRLRQACAHDVIVSTPVGYALGDAGASDFGLAAAGLVDAERLLPRDPRAAERIAGDALALWRGEPGADLPDSEAADELTASAERLRTGLLRVRARARFDADDQAGALADLDALGDTALRDETLVGLRLRALEAAGRRTEALRVFADHRERLADELGADPSADLVRLHADLLREPAPAETRSRLTVGLRTAPNVLIGRDADVARIDALLAQARLVTILGPGGLGKTRLAQEVARHQSQILPGVVVVELAGVRAGDDVTLALATTLGIREARVGRVRLGEPGVAADVRELILLALDERPTLLVVDNCEHVIEAAASWVADILASTENVRVLATSRSPLAIGAERVYPLESLASAPAGAEEGAAVVLFRERARAARPGVALPRDTVARLCTRLDGLPLAIELAAARVRSMSVDEIERRLENRFALLTGGDRSAPERHRTLTAVIDWSWNLLGDRERVLLRRLSRFPDGFGADAAQIVGAAGIGPDLSTGAQDHGDVADALDGLVTQSLVSVADDASTGAARYRMLETVREFGDRELLAAGEADLVERAMSRWAEAFCVEAAARLDGRDQVSAFEALALEQDNLTTILRAALRADRPDVSVSLFAALGYSWSLRGNQSDVISFGAAVLDGVRSYEPDDAHLTATALTLALAGGTALFSGNTRVSHPALSALRKLRARRRLEPARTLVMVDILLSAVQGPEVLRARLPSIVSSPDSSIAEIGLILSAQLAENRGLLAEARRLAERAYRSAGATGNVWASASAAGFLAQLGVQSAAPEEALLWAVRAREGLEAIGARGDLHELDRRIAAAEIATGRFDLGRRLFEGILNGEEEVPAFDRDDVRLQAACGLAEIDHLEGRERESLERYDLAVAELRGVPGAWEIRRWPQLIVAASAAVAAHAVREAEPVSPADTDALATSLRVRVIALHRVRAAFEDTPVAGAAAFAIGAWLVWPARHASAEVRDIGLRLVLLAESLGSRQDVGPLETAAFVAGLGARFGAARVAEVRSELALASADQRLEKVHELLARREMRRPFGAV
ncbi:BTAD domain-containing putative transcriptional regulator [Frondihabitans peucedani]|uniref:ATPase n=1 Tax=Frondihabitans peucedani TaxID=598626 RepID=A0ABP8DXZ4_9MICO